MYSTLPLAFYQHHDVVEIARNLLGKFLMTDINDEGITGGMIVETEAYAGTIDKASHAFGNRKTDRTRVMYEKGGIAYIYLIYGFHHLFNVVTNVAEVPHAVLIRAIEPTVGVEIMMRRRNLTSPEKKLTSGPGVLCKALGITKAQNREGLIDGTIWIEDRGISIGNKDIVTGPRVNVSYAEEDALLPYRFSIRNNKWVSKG